MEDLREHSRNQASEYSKTDKPPDILLKNFPASTKILSNFHSVVLILQIWTIATHYLSLSPLSSTKKT